LTCGELQDTISLHGKIDNVPQLGPTQLTAAEEMKGREAKPERETVVRGRSLETGGAAESFLSRTRKSRISERLNDEEDDMTKSPELGVLLQR